MNNHQLQYLLSFDEPPLDRRRVFPRPTDVFIQVNEQTARELAAGRVPPDVLIQAAVAVDSLEGRF